VVLKHDFKAKEINCREIFFGVEWGVQKTKVFETKVFETKVFETKVFKTKVFYKWKY